MIDTVLDRSIALGYGNAGLLVRRRLPGWPADPPRIDGATVLVTGAASGLGLASAIGFARLGATVHALARSEPRALEAVARITAAVPGADARPTSCDVSDLNALRVFAGQFAEREPHLEVLVNNAGVMPDDRTASADGHELMFATHVLAPLGLTAGLAPSLERSAPARVINVSSGGMYGQALPVGDWESVRTTYNPKKLYARTKREEVMVTEFLAERLRDRGIIVHAMHPGWADTEGVRRWMPVFRKMTRPIIRSPDQGADTIVWLGAAPEPLRETGLFWQDRRPRPTHYRLGASPGSESDREALWGYCVDVLNEAGIDGLEPGRDSVA
ncbi:MAG TPA: SDR family NAD(P)-dependent oxidoreductase [Solirubrobacteraceae bacterium]|nr:SDR family NAD(P)-dependent oxidoreductase [Solirubrobacteraceae bacterium]